MKVFLRESKALMSLHRDRLQCEEEKMTQHENIFKTKLTPSNNKTREYRKFSKLPYI